MSSAYVSLSIQLHSHQCTPLQNRYLASRLIQHICTFALVPSDNMRVLTSICHFFQCLATMRLVGHFEKWPPFCGPFTCTTILLKMHLNYPPWRKFWNLHPQMAKNALKLSTMHREFINIIFVNKEGDEAHDVKRLYRTRKSCGRIVTLAELFLNKSH